jgi:hypothetical protein
MCTVQNYSWVEKAVKELVDIRASQMKKLQIVIGGRQ